jgi:hypothetical protein
MEDYRLHPITWKNVIDYNWLQLQITITPYLASWTKIHFDPFMWYFSDIRDYMDVQSIFGLFLQLNWKETTFVASWKNIYVKTSFNIPLIKLFD